MYNNKHLKPKMSTYLNTSSNFIQIKHCKIDESTVSYIIDIFIYG